VFAPRTLRVLNALSFGDSKGKLEGIYDIRLKIPPKPETPPAKAPKIQRIFLFQAILVNG